MKDTIIVDNSPHSYVFQPFNAIPIRNFIDDMSERARALPATPPPQPPRPRSRVSCASCQPPPIVRA